MAEREMAAKDNRNTYLLTEGEIDEENRGDMNDRDFEKRQQNQKEKETKLRNPLFFVNPHRLLVKNLGPHITSNYLKQICIYATKQGIALSLVDLHEVKLTLRPKDGIISTNVIITQSVVPQAEDRSASKASRGFGFVEFKEHIHALECLRFLNNNPAFAWAAFRTPSLVALYERCGETLENNPHVLAKLDIPHLMEMKLPKNKTGESASRLIVEFAVSNHNVLKQQRDRHKEKKVEESVVTPKESTKREFFDISSKDKKQARAQFQSKRTRKIRGDYDKDRKKPKIPNKHMAKKMRLQV
ncbi:hypothetical protein WA171_000621 [Blastocystis sp. BT1]